MLKLNMLPHIIDAPVYDRLEMHHIPGKWEINSSLKTKTSRDF